MPLPSTMTPIATQTVTSNVSSVTFSSLPTTYTDLVLVAYIVSNTGTNDIGIRFNGDTGSNYSRTYMGGNGSSSYSGRNTNETVGYGMFFSTAGCQNVMNLMNYSNSTTYKTYLIRAGQAADSTAAHTGLWRSTAAISSVTLTAMANSIAAGSTFTLYGVKAA